uniref:DEAD domain-containing protein n=1 Tax=Pristionchus pacificus TaxID=54126 RepID=A0A8R1US64_PRIPA
MTIQSDNSGAVNLCMRGVDQAHTSESREIGTFLRSCVFFLLPVYRFSICGLFSIRGTSLSTFPVSEATSHHREADNVCSSCKNCGSAVTGQPMAFPTPIQASLKPTASSTPSTFVFKSEPMIRARASTFTGHNEKGGMQDKFFDQEVELSIGTKLTEDIVKVESFDDLEFRLPENVANAGYTKPTPIQKYAMKSIQNGKDLMACSQTGSGKTATFLLPIMNSLRWYTDPSLITDVPCKPQARILAPTKGVIIVVP